MLSIPSKVGGDAAYFGNSGVRAEAEVHVSLKQNVFFLVAISCYTLTCPNDTFGRAILESVRYFMKV